MQINRIHFFQMQTMRRYYGLRGVCCCSRGGSQTTHGVTVLVSTPGEETTTSFRQGGHLEQQTILHFFIQIHANSECFSLFDP